MMRRIFWIAALVLIVAGFVYPKLKPLWMASAQGGTEAVSGKGGQKNSKNAAPLQVATFEVKPAAFAETIASTGTLRADEGVELQAETNGKVMSINFVEGTAVKKGTLLVKLNDNDLKASLERYGYSKKLAVTRERRYAQLLAQKVVTQDEYDTALTDVNIQQANIELTQAQIEKTEVRAPFDGVVGLRYVSLGAYVNANTRIATLQRLDKLKIDFAIPEKYSGRIKSGAQIEFSVAGGLKKFTGRIYAIDPRIDSNTRTLLLRAVCPNDDGALLPGAFANVVVQLEKIDNALLVPAEAVIPGLDEKNVFVMKDGVAERRPVEIGSRTATQVHILAGLKPGEVLIMSGLQQMRAGQPVLPLQAAPMKKAQDHKIPDEKSQERGDQHGEAKRAPGAQALAQTGASGI